MNKSTITRERLQEIAEDGFLKHGESKELARMVLAAMDSEPVAWTDEEELRDANESGSGYLFGIERDANKFADPRRQIMLYRHAQPAPELAAIVERLNLSGYEYEGGEVTPQNAAAIVDTLLQQLDDAVQGRNAQPAPERKPVKRFNADQMHRICLEANRHFDKYGAMAKEVNKLLGRTPAPAVPEEKPMPNTLSMYAVDAVAAIAEVRGWNACRTTMLQAGNSPDNDITNGKPFTITLPDISSKAFWSGTGKAEVFHPETYRRWAKEAIERYCAIAQIDVEVK